MTTSRLAILLAVLLTGLSSVYMLPKTKGFMPVGINLELPDGLGEWWGRDGAITEKEREVLGPGTEFARKQYTNGRGDLILASVVLAGDDMMTSIHRPERCLNAQGWACSSTGGVSIDVPGYGKVPVARLFNRRVEQRPDGTQVAIENICYYWFAGNRDLTASHAQRVWFDNRDRLKNGYVQRWAMMLISANITSAQSKFGRNEKAVDELLAGFVRQLAPKLHRDTVHYQ